MTACDNYQLFRLVIDYDRQRTEDLSAVDMAEPISARDRAGFRP